ncbi:MAG: putative glycosyltransferase [Alphaproteobacteria bacterium]
MIFMQQRAQPRVLIYSHDTFGLGHLRRCSAIAHALCEQNEELSVLILSGSPIIGSFDFRSRVDFVRVPGVIKLRNGEYTSLTLPMAVEDTIAMRASIIRHTAEFFDPDIFIVDKEPLGLRGELADTLEVLKERGAHIVLGLRDVLDEPRLLGPEWKRKGAIPALEKYYDEIWVYGLPQICEPLADIDLPDSLRRKLIYTGYLRRFESAAPVGQSALTKSNRPYTLVTPGGGGDGETLVDWVLRAHESDPGIPNPSMIVLGPFMNSERRSEFIARAEALESVEAITFEAHMESLVARAAGIVAMGGYNTFCEILSFDKKALIVPRTMPRLEQYIRASRAEELGLVSMLCDDGMRAAETMATALRHLPQQKSPSDIVVPGLLDGLDNVEILTNRMLENRPKAARPEIATSRQQA